MPKSHVRTCARPSTALWLVAQVAVMPMMGAGPFSSQMGGAMAAMGSLVGYLLYGSLSGVVAGSGQPQVVQA